MDEPIKQEPKVTWMGRPVLNAEHLKDLERKAAVNEFVNKMVRPVAEEQAYRSYVKQLHIEGAAHHLGQLKASNATGQKEEANKAAVLYGLHMAALGYRADDPVPPEVQARHEADVANDKGPIQFRHNQADQLLLDGSKPQHPENT